MFQYLALVVLTVTAVAGDTYSWSKITANQATKPSARFDAGCAQNFQTAYVFGGNTVNGLANDLWSLDLRAGSFKWTLVPMVGELPAKRKDSSAFFFWDSLYVWGGTNKSVVFGDMWKYTPALNTFTWEKVSATEQASLLARTGTFATNFNGRVVTFGGKSPAGFTNDVIQYSFWGNQVTPKVLPPYKGQGPSPRQYTPLAVSGASLYAFGGSNGTNQPDFWSARLNLFGTETVWTRLASGPPARSGHVTFADSWNRKIIIHSGEDKSGATSLNDLWEYDIFSATWKNVTVASSPIRRLGACQFTAPSWSILSDRYVIYGGVTGFSTGDYKLDDIWELLSVRS